ncbi:MAG: hypothetical protein HY291_24315 [Planctomycetes bacterium]|nr:hypothetical protein [Planctomycetota bacterium]
MNAGLCATCRHVKTLRNDRGSVFFMCTLAEKDTRFRKYPPLPVLKCEGYEQAGGAKDETKRVPSKQG